MGGLLVIEPRGIFNRGGSAKLTLDARLGPASTCRRNKESGRLLFSWFFPKGACEGTCDSIPQAILRSATKLATEHFPKKDKDHLAGTLKKRNDVDQMLIVEGGRTTLDKSR